MPEDDQIYNTPAFQFYPGDFDSDTADWTLEEVGLYIRLLNYQWRHGFIPSDEKRLMLAARTVDQRAFDECWNTVGAKFPVWEDGYRRNRRLEEEREKQRQYREQKSEAGQKGAKKRWGDGTANGDAMAPPKAEEGHRQDSANSAEMALQSSPSGVSESKDSGDKSPLEILESLPPEATNRDVVFQVGVPLLTQAGEKSQHGRSFLGKQMKENEAKLAEVIMDLARDPAVDPKAYIQRAVLPKDPNQMTKEQRRRHGAYVV